jgi:Viral alkaline exonuclease
MFFILATCKHALALLASVHYKSTAPSCTEKACYWKKSVLATVGDLRLPVSRFTKTEKSPKFTSHYASNGSFVQDVTDYMLLDPATFGETMLFRQVSDQGQHPLSMHTLAYKFAKLGIRESPGGFLAFAGTQYSDKLVHDVAKGTTTQSICPLWKELRYGRITASIFNDVHACSTESQKLVLVKKIFGAAEVHQTFAMTNGLNMEEPVRKRFAADRKKKR